jgi:DNA-binding NarL/FixJ family response regulator
MTSRSIPWRAFKDMWITSANESTSLNHLGREITTGLSAHEREVMLLMVEGLSNREIARQLSMTESAAKVHLHSVYEKLASNNRAALAVLVTPQPGP